MQSITKKQTITQKLGAPPDLPFCPTAKIPPSMREMNLKITVATPMAGGGVEAGEIDMDRPIRVPSVKGHLRYWWRMMNRSSPGRESDIWGSTDSPGKVYVSVSEVQQPNLRYCDNNFGFDTSDPRIYALFSLLSNKKTPGKNIAQENFSFTLNIRYPDEYHDDVRLALSAWIYFGGIGSRTRRGCGSLSCDENPAGLMEILRAAPYITLWRKKADDSMPAWYEAVKRYRDYRQERNPGQANRPGRSHWPEADSLRQITGRADYRHRNPITSPLPSFPRAALGMPIIFHFKDRDDPEDVIITPKIEASSRMASPVITKALRDKGTWYSAVIILPHEDIFDIPLEINGQEYELQPMRGTIYRNTAPMQGKPDAVSGFEEYISGNKFTREAVR